MNQALIKSGYETYSTRFPERTSEIGKMINQYLQNSTELSDQAIHLLFSANRWEYQKIIEGKLKLLNGATANRT